MGNRRKLLKRKNKGKLAHGVLIHAHTHTRVHHPGWPYTEGGLFDMPEDYYESLIDSRGPKAYWRDALVDGEAKMTEAEFEQHWADSEGDREFAGLAEHFKMDLTTTRFIRGGIAAAKQGTVQELNDPYLGIKWFAAPAGTPANPKWGEFMERLEHGEHVADIYGPVRVGLGPKIYA
jgi:hypothetical protein